MKISLIWSLLFCLTSNAENQTRKYLSELYQIRSELKKAVFDKSRFEQDIIKFKIDIENQNSLFFQNQKETESLKVKILDRISTLYKIKRAYPQGTLISIVKEEDFLRKSYYLNFLNNQDRLLVDEFKIKTLENHQLKLKIQVYMKRLLDLQNKNNLKYTEFLEREIKQRELIRQIRESVKVQGPAGSDQILMNQNFFSELRGQLELPIDGNIKGAFGLVRDSETQLAILKTGLYIISPNAFEVRSVFEGEVLYTENVPGWGPTIIIDHGESYYSVYSYIKNLSVRPGDRVFTQQKLAEVAHVIYDNQKTERGVYFEIRHYSEPVDPRFWFKGAQQ